MTKITKVALVGATGNLGPAILNQLLDSGFQVSVLTRKTSTHNFPPSVTVLPVDYDSIDSLTDALKGQDAVISTIATAALNQQLLLVKAAATAQVKRFIPSEFGSNTLNENTARLPAYTAKIAVQAALKENAAAAGGMTYTLICNGPFLDWGMMVGFIMNVREKSINLYDGGERTFSTTSLPTIGKAVVGVLNHPEETKNRAVYVQDTATTLKELLERGKKAVGPDGWKENFVSTKELLENSWVEARKDNPDPAKYVIPFQMASIWGEGFGCHFQQLDNELLGIKEMGDAEVQAVVDKFAK